jgi:hypothetical protein
MNSKEFKKLTDQNKSKQNTNERSIKQKETEKQETKKKLGSVYDDKRHTKEKLDELTRKRIEISDEVKRLEAELKLNKNEMNRKKADCIYKTKQEYEAQICFYENEMKLKKTFSPSEEKRLLEDIRVNKKGILTLAEVDKMKQICDQLDESLNVKKRERNTNWTEFQDYKERLNGQNETINRLKTEYAQIDLELRDLGQKKVELKKAFEDLARENLVNKRQQQANLKKIVSESTHKQRKVKELDVNLTENEENMRDVDKLINYFKKLQNESSYSPESSFSLENTNNNNNNNNNSSSQISNKLLHANHIASTSSSSSSLVSLPNTTSSNVVQNQDQKRTDSMISNGSLLLPRPDRINLSACLAFPVSRETTTPCSPTPWLTTPMLMDGQEPPGGGHFHMKQKMDDDVFAKSMGVSSVASMVVSLNRKRFYKKPKSKASTPVAHSLDVIVLLEKMNIPIQLSSQPDECLQMLKKRKEEFMNEQTLYKDDENTFHEKVNETDANRMTTVVDAVNQLNLNAATSAVATVKSSVDNQTNSDTKSEISSCLDSNYESDNNAGGATSSGPSFYLSDEQENDRMTSSHSILLPKELTVGNLERQITITNSLVLTNSDDSDVTVNEAPLNSKKKDEQQKSSNFIDLNEKDTSKESNSPCKTPTLDDSKNQTNKNDDNDNNEIKPPAKTFMRMNSDGYCSSCTPLSASSINNESPNKNPFFQASANGGGAENVDENDAKDLHF